MKKMMITIIAAVLVIVLAGGAVTYILIMHSVSGTSEATVTTAETAATLYTYPLEDSFVTNVKDSNKLFKLTVVLVLNEDPAGEELAASLEADSYEMRDCINSLLRTKTAADLTAENVEDSLRTEIASALNEKLGVEYFVSAYFTDFVLS